MRKAYFKPGGVEMENWDWGAGIGFIVLAWVV
jgi:hypothetical protein